MASELFAAAAVVCVGCSDRHAAYLSDAMNDAARDAMDDAPLVSRCWLDTYNTGGSVELGTGVLSFEPMPSTVMVEYGFQSDYYLPTEARISGLDPGDPDNSLDPKNPITRFHAWFADTTPPTAVQDGNCGTTIGYVGPAGGPFDMSHGSSVLFPNNLTGPQIFGRPLTIVVEVIDDHDNYAMAQQTVTLAPPAGGGD